MQVNYQSVHSAQTKQCGTINQSINLFSNTTENVMYWPCPAGHGAKFTVAWMHSNTLLMKSKLSFAGRCELEIVCWLRLESVNFLLCALGSHLAWACPTWHCLCKFMCIIPFVSEGQYVLRVLHHFWLLLSSHFLFHINLCGLKGMGLMTTSHLGLSVPKSLAFQTFSNCGSSSDFPWTFRRKVLLVRYWPMRTVESN